MTQWVHGTGHPLLAAEQHLRQINSCLDQGITQHGPCALLDRPHTHIHVLIKTIIEQQLSVKESSINNLNS
jgi:hypothetical protein